MRTIKGWEIEDCGVDAPDYFQGRGVAFSTWDDCAVGCGNSPREAADDAAESLAQAELYHYAAIYVKAKV